MKNGLPVSALSEFVNEVRAAPGEAKASYGVHARWETGTRLVASAEPMHLGGRCVARSFSWKIDEPRQLLGANHGLIRRSFCSRASRAASGSRS